MVVLSNNSRVLQKIIEKMTIMKSDEKIQDEDEKFSYRKYTNRGCRSEKKIKAGIGKAKEVLKCLILL